MQKLDVVMHSTQSELRSAFNDNHSQCHVAERGRVLCPVLQLSADPIKIKPEHLGTLAKVDPELIDGHELAAAKRTNMRAGDVLLVLDRPEWVGLAHEFFGIAQQARLNGSLLAAHPRKRV